MIILSDCLMEKPDEGCLKVANSLIRRIKERDPQTTVISYGRQSPLSDRHMNLNKLMLNRELLSLLIRKNEAVLYIPNASATLPSILRVFLLSILTGQRIKLLVTLRYEVNALMKLLLKQSKAELICLSAESADYYGRIVGNKATYLKTGVDTDKFVPVLPQKKEQLREKYGIAAHETVVLHVGHLKKGRNLDKLCLLGQQYRIVIVVSSATEADEELRKKLLSCPNIRLIESYVERIEELYQLSDVYFFPVVHGENCIDVPLSVLEAASCGVPAVVTAYGELQVFQGCPGLYFLEQFDAESMETAVGQMRKCPHGISRQAVLEYDWNHSLDRLLEGANSGER